MFVVLESLDGGGKGAQRGLVAAKLRQKGFLVDEQEFPNHQSCLYREIIHPALHNQLSVSPRDLFTAFALDQSLCSTRISEASKNGFFLADGYFTTNLAYQVLVNKIVSLDEALKLSSFLGLLIPDQAIYLDVSPETALARKAKESGHEEGPDVYERDLTFQSKLRGVYKKLCREQLFCAWKEISGEGSLEEVTSRLLTVTMGMC
ncbi:MAG: hypothetical protein Q8N84_03140 [bacterium]|nr:hypothetical protein [bacterium]